MADSPNPTERELDGDAASQAISRAFQKKLRTRDAVDARFDPILAAMDVVTDRFELLAGENIYMLAVLLLGSIEDAPSDIRELFRGAVVQALLKDRDSGRVLRALCLEGRL